MKELVIISGKGGTGKTSITAAFAALAKNAVLADCDVAAADLHLILEPKIKVHEDFRAGKLATINPDLCTGCGRCITSCRFHAISFKNDLAVVDPIACEGCSVCSLVCPEDAVTMNEKVCGWWYISDTRQGSMAHAKLKAGEENSGKLVSLVRTKARELAEKIRADLILIDGPPGIGCPVIASVGGVSAALVVTEPTKSGVHDLERVLKLTRHFRIPTYICINKCDINPRVSGEIEARSKKSDVEIVGKIPYDLDITKALLEKKSVVEFSEGEASQRIKEMWETLRGKESMK